MKRKRRRTSPETTADLMGRLMERLGGTGRMDEFRAYGAYREAVGPVLGARSEAEALRGKTLFVAVDSSPLAHELTLLKSDVLERMNAILGSQAVDDIRTRVRSSPGRPPTAQQPPHARQR